MTYYKKILPRENKRRLDRLAEYRNLVIDYFGNSKYEWMAEKRIEQTRAEEARVKINRMLDEIYDIVLASGINPSVVWTPPPMIGGYVRDIDLIHNMFSLHQFQIAPQNLLDNIDRSIGIYESNMRPALVRAWNPFFYLGLVFDWLAGLPFLLIGRAGFNRNKAESSLIGRAFKGIIYIITTLAAFLTILHLLDKLQPIKQIVKDWQF